MGRKPRWEEDVRWGLWRRWRRLTAWLGQRDRREGRNGIARRSGKAGSWARCSQAIVLMALVSLPVYFFASAQNSRHSNHSKDVLENLEEIDGLYPPPPDLHGEVDTKPVDSTDAHRYASNRYANPLPPSYNPRDHSRVGQDEREMWREANRKGLGFDPRDRQRPSLPNSPGIAWERRSGTPFGSDKGFSGNSFEMEEGRGWGGVEELGECGQEWGDVVEMIRKRGILERELR
eukprot:1368124-Amorphochlora_amoeboformis.AAC.1